MNSQISEIAKLLKESEAWTILCHEKPDGDTLGSALALYSLALRLGKKAIIGGRDDLPEKYAFLPRASEYRTITSADVLPNSLVIAVDISTKGRAIDGLEDVLSAHKSVAIDHHADNENFCGINLVDAKASATAELVTELMNCEFDITRDEATCLYTALVTDCGDFRFASVSPKTHKTAEILIEAGACQNEIDDKLNENMTLAALKLWGRAMANAEIFADGYAAILCLSNEDYLSLETDQSVTENLVNQLLRLKGVKVALFVSEFNGKIKLSIRTKQPCIAREIAAFYSGGGHNEAAGAKLCEPLDTAVAELKNRVEEYVKIRLSDNK